MEQQPKTQAQASKDEKLEKQLDKALASSMDASDPAAIVQPGDHGEPLESSGFDPEKEAELAEEAEHAAAEKD